MAQRILDYVPLPQTGTATNNYIYASPANQNLNRWDLRVDQILSDKHNLYFRYSSQVTDDGVVATLPPGAQGNYYAGSGAQNTNSKSFVLVDNKVWTSNLVSSVHIGWNYLTWNNFFPSQGLDSVGIPGVSTSYPGFSQIAVTGITTLGVSNVPNTDGSQNRQLNGDLTWIKGAHTLKFGVQAWWLQTNFLSSQVSSGIFNFNGEFTKNAFGDFAAGGILFRESLSNWSYLALRTPYTHFFVQDDWKVSHRLTLNVGLRYELSPPAVENGNTIANFDLDSNPGHPRLVLAGSQGSSIADRALQNVDHKQFAPRIGFAYALPDSKTVLRGGYGIFYSNFITEGGMQSMEINPPFNVRSNLTANPGAPPTLLLDNGFAPGSLSLANAKNVQLISYDRGSTVPMAQEWNFNLQRQLPGGILIEAGYYGNKLDHMWREIDGNPAPPEPGTPNANRLYTSATIPGTPYTVSLANAIRIQKDGWSAYNGLQAKAEKRYSKGLTFIASYSYSKTISLGDTAFVQNYLNSNADRAVSSQDMTQHFVASAVYDLPFGKGRAFPEPTGTG